MDCHNFYSVTEFPTERGSLGVPSVPGIILCITLLLEKGRIGAAKMHVECRIDAGHQCKPLEQLHGFLEAFHPTAQEYQMSLIPSEAFNMLLLPNSKGKKSFNLLLGRL